MTAAIDERVCDVWLLWSAEFDAYLTYDPDAEWGPEHSTVEDAQDATCFESLEAARRHVEHSNWGGRLEVHRYRQTIRLERTR